MKLSRLQLARTYQAVNFAYPFRRWNLIKQDADFLSDSYRTAWGSWHRGIDLNGVGGGATDLGMVIQSMFPGEVVGVEAQSGWGQVVLVRSDDWVRQLASYILGFELETLDVQYAHLEQRSVELGYRLNAGDHLGSLGGGDKNLDWRSVYRSYVPHLHLEMRFKKVPTIVHQKGASRQSVLEQCLNPNTVLDRFKFSSRGNTVDTRRRVLPVRLADTPTGVSFEKLLITNVVDDKFYLRF